MSLRYTFIIRPNGTSYEKCNSKAFRLGIKPASSGLLAFFATGPGLGLIMYILTTLEFLNITLNFISDDSLMKDLMQ